MFSKTPKLASWIDCLNDPQLVARFQAACGIKVKRNEEAEQFTFPKHKTEHVGDPRDSVCFRNGVPSDTAEVEITENNSINNPKGISGESFGVQFTIESRVWYYLAQLGGAMGDEVFYALFFPFWFWNIDGAVCRRVVYIWAIMMYIGQGLKDIIRWPRPASPPVVRLEQKWELEYGMPSTHAIAASAIPFSVLFFTSSRYQYEFAYGLAIAILWCTIVSYSRIYLGMHSVLDVLVGLSIVVVLFPWVTSLADSIDPVVLQHPYGGLFLLAGGILLIIMIPGGDKWTPARGDTVLILGTCVGLNMGAWVNFHLGIIRGPALDPPYLVLWPSFWMLGLSFLRLVTGLLIVYATKALVKKTIIPMLSELFCRSSLLIKSDKAPQQRKEVFIELMSKFVTYFTLGFVIVFFCPVVFRLIGIARPTFHTEV